MIAEYNISSDYDIMLSLFTAPPESPFPTIEGCRAIAHGQPCVLTTYLARDITCSVFQYYPNITLHFRHNSNIMKTIKHEQNENTDLTKNKSITITAVASEEPYICAASNVPGSVSMEEYTTTLYLTLQSVDTAAELVTYPNNMNSSDNSYYISEYEIKTVEYLNTAR